MNCFSNYLWENPQVTSEELINSYIDGNMNILDIWNDPNKLDNI